MKEKGNSGLILIKTAVFQNIFFQIQSGFHLVSNIRLTKLKFVTEN